jgi:hypothetical protein
LYRNGDLNALTGNIFVDIFCTKCHSNWTKKNIKNMGKVLFLAFSEVWLSLLSFLQNSQLPKGTVWRAILNFTQAGHALYG